MKEVNRLQIVIPSGELQKETMQCLQASGLVFIPSSKDYFIPVENAPIDLIHLRASDVPRVICNPNATPAVGITGSDIFWEEGLGKDVGEELPFEEANPANLYVGVTKSYEEKVTKDQRRPFQLSDLSQQMVVTKFPKITQEVLPTFGVTEATIYQAPGKTEGFQYVFPNCVGILDIIQSGKTAESNRIRPIHSFYTVSTRMVAINYKLQGIHQRIFDDLKDKMQAYRDRKRLS